MWVSSGLQFRIWVEPVEVFIVYMQYILHLWPYENRALLGIHMTELRSSPTTSSDTRLVQILRKSVQRV
jgi:hypothetical protein